LLSNLTFFVFAFSGCWLSDPFNNYLGRRGTIFVTAIILITTPIASGFTHSWQALFIVRCILGIGMGAKGMCSSTNLAVHCLHQPVV
jgi:MFS family permease